MREISAAHFKELANATPRDLEEYKSWLSTVIDWWQEYVRRGMVGTGWLDLYRCVLAVSANANELGILNELPRLRLRRAPEADTLGELSMGAPLRQVAYGREPVLRYLSKCQEVCNAIDRKALRGRAKQSERDGGANADYGIDKLESKTPPLDRDSGKWIKNKRAADLEGIETRTLADYRTQGIKTADGNLGRDKDGRVWRRKGTPRSHPWYLRSTLRADSK